MTMLKSMCQRVARRCLGLDANNIPKPRVIEKIVYKERQAGCAPQPDLMSGWK